MGVKLLLIILTVIALRSCFAQEEPITTKRFPNNFLLGVVTAAAQIEGGWQEDGKGESIWDNTTHANRSYVLNEDTLDVACDSYHKWEEDIQMLKYLNVTHYRFSISWPRLLPTGHVDNINQKGIDYYNKLINGLIANNIMPLVTIFHWDTPQAIEDEGGWLNPAVIDSYADYADLCFKSFGDRVKFWLTFNEPKQTCTSGYGKGSMPPLIHSPGDGEYICSQHVVLSHAKAWHLYDKKYRASQQGQVGITVDSPYIQPEDPKNESHVEAADISIEFNLGLYLTPLYTGDYSTEMRKTVDYKSVQQGYNKSRLPYFTDEEKYEIKGTLDYLGLNCYTALIARPSPNPSGKGVEGDPDVELYKDPNWTPSGSEWLKVTPWACRDLIKWVHKKYQPNQIFITENGVSSDRRDVDDDFRISYHQSYLSKIRETLDEGINLIGYTIWSLMDNFEWSSGYTPKFGLYDVDFEDDSRPRVPKKSAHWFRRFTTTKCLVDKCDN